MRRYFGLSILVAMFLAYLFPYWGTELMPYAFIFLFLLLLMSGLFFDKKIFSISRNEGPILIIGLFLICIFFPLLQLLFARWLLSDNYLIWGLYYTSLMPVAIVSPYFSDHIEMGSGGLAFKLMWLSTLILPLSAPLMLSVSSNLIFLDINNLALIKSSLILCIGAPLLSLILLKTTPRLADHLKRHSTFFNMLFLSLLIYILVSSILAKNAIGGFSISEIEKLFLLSLFQDFGVLIVMIFLISWTLDSKKMRKEIVAISISAAMKNSALAAGGVLFFAPKASLSIAMTFVAHSLFFTFLGIRPVRFFDYLTRSRFTK